MDVFQPANIQRKQINFNKDLNHDERNQGTILLSIRFLNEIKGSGSLCADEAINEPIRGRLTSIIK